MYPRFIEPRIHVALGDTRVVFLSGPRQSGKTTLAKHIAGRDFAYYTFDDITTREAARADPVGFIKGLDRAVIDEVQRIPDILLAIKASVDNDPRPGRFLLTGSANLHTLPKLADSLAGRMEIIKLLPLAQAELGTGNAISWIDRVFSRMVFDNIQDVSRNQLIDIVFAGGYPEAITRRQWRRRVEWYRQYVTAILQRDIQDIAQIEQMEALPGLLRMLGQYSAQLVNYSQIGAPVDLNHVTTRKYLGIFENLFFVHTLLPWYSNKLSRLIKTPKLHFYDTGLLASVNALTPDQARQDRTVFGSLLESFVFSELIKHAGWSEDNYTFSHYRDKDKREVDFVIENSAGQIVGVEVKAASTVTAKDFSGLRKLAEARGKTFVAGIVLYDHHDTVPFGANLFALPISTLWS